MDKEQIDFMVSQADRIKSLESRLALYEGWTPEDAETKWAIAMCESSFCGEEGCYEGRTCDRCKAENLIARALRAVIKDRNDNRMEYSAAKGAAISYRLRAEKAEAALKDGMLL